MSEGQRYDTVTIEGTSTDDFAEIVDTIDALGWERHDDRADHVFWIADNYWTWSASDDIFDVRVKYEQYEAS